MGVFDYTKLFIPQSEIRERSEVRRSMALLLDASNCGELGRLGKNVEKCKVESSAYEWIGH